MTMTNTRTSKPPTMYPILSILPGVLQLWKYSCSASLHHITELQRHYFRKENQEEGCPQILSLRSDPIQ